MPVFPLLHPAAPNADALHGSMEFDSVIVGVAEELSVIDIEPVLLVDPEQLGVPTWDVVKD